MKRILSIALLLMMVMSLAACGGQKKEQDLLNKILDDGVLTIATSPDYPPYEFEDATKTGQDAYVGADMSLARYIAKELGVELKIEAMDFDACLGAISTGTVDLCIAGLTPDDQRRQTMDFSKIYSDEGDRCIVIRAEDADKYKTITDFEGKKIACLNGSSQEAVVAKYLSTDHMELVKSFTDGILMLQTGKVEGVSMSTMSASNYVNNSDEFAIMDEYFPYEEEMGLAVGVVKGETALVAKVDEIIDKVAEQGLFPMWVEEAYEVSNLLQGEAN